MTEERYCLWCKYSKNHFDCDTFELLDSHCTIYPEFRDPYTCKEYVDNTKATHTFVILND